MPARRNGEGIINSELELFTEVYSKKFIFNVCIVAYYNHIEKLSKEKHLQKFVVILRSTCKVVISHLQCKSDASPLFTSEGVIT